MEDYSAKQITGATGLADGSSSGKSSTNGTVSSGSWERSVLESVLQSFVQEKRRARRWGIFFKLAGLALLLGLVMLLSGRLDSSGKASDESQHTALIEVTGVIDTGADANADAINAALRTAFKDAKTAGVVMRINSPGGSPVQAGMIVDEIRRLKLKYPKIPFYVVVEEMCASGGYYIAAAADKIMVDKASLVGSIGVLMDGFGFVGAMEKFGVERRLLTAGANKGFLDSFSPITDEQKKFAQAMLGEIHQQFIDVVRKGRGTRLKETAETFSGLFWTGAKAVEMGLADDFGSVESIARDLIKVENVVDFSPKENIAERLAKKIGVSVGDSIGRTLSVGSGRPALR